MPIPTQRAIEPWLLRELARRDEPARPGELYKDLAMCFPDMTEDDLAAELKHGENKFNNRVQWARQGLVNQGLLDNSKRGFWALTYEGRNAAESLNTSNVSQGSPNNASAPDPSPPALLDLIEQHERQTREQLQAILGELDPYYFEQVAGQLLRAMGFRQVEVTQRAGDGGIDGYGRLKLGVVAVRAAFQCKRQQQVVGRPEIDKFRGAIQGRYDQGIFITTSGFTKDAAQASIQPGSVNIVMVDIEGLIDLMIEHQIGVSNQPLMVPQIDEDFFRPEVEDSE